MVIIPALTMVSTIRFRSFKTFDLQTRRSSAVLVLVAVGLVLLAAEPQYVLRRDGVHLSGVRLHRLRAGRGLHRRHGGEEESTRPAR